MIDKKDLSEGAQLVAGIFIGLLFFGLFILGLGLLKTGVMLAMELEHGRAPERSLYEFTPRADISDVNGYVYFREGFDLELIDMRGNVVCELKFLGDANYGLHGCDVKANNEYFIVPSKTKKEGV